MVVLCVTFLGRIASVRSVTGLGLAIQVITAYLDLPDYLQQTAGCFTLDLLPNGLNDLEDILGLHAGP